MNNDMIDFNTNAMRLIPLFSRSDDCSQTMYRTYMQTQHGCCWFQAEATFFASQKTRRADFDTEVKICTALGIAAIAFLPFVLSSSNFCSEYGKTLRL